MERGNGMMALQNLMDMGLFKFVILPLISCMIMIMGFLLSFLALPLTTASSSG